MTATDPGPPRVVSTGVCCGRVPGGLAGKPQVVACMLCPESVAWWRNPDRPDTVSRWDEKTGRGLLGMAAPAADG